MGDDGYTTEQIVTEMMTRWGFRPRQAWRHAHGLTQLHVADHYNQLVSDPDSFITDKRISDYENWPIGGAKPTLPTLGILAQIYGTTAVNLVDLYDREKLTNQERIALRPSPQPPAQRVDVSSSAVELNTGTPGFLAPRTGSMSPQAFGTGSVGNPQHTWYGLYDGYGADRSREAFIMASADESSGHAARARATNVGPMTLEELSEDVIRLARVSGSQDILQFVPEMVWARNRIYTLLDGRQYPNQTTDLYFLAGVICGVLADASDCLGYYMASLEHARAALTYADIIDHNSLRVWARLMQSSLAKDDDRPKQALSFARAGQQYAHTAACRVRLYSSEGQALSLMGDSTRAMDAFRSAQEAAETDDGGPDDLFDDVGGTYQYTPAKMHRAMALGYLQTGMPTEAINSAQTGIDMYASGPAENRDYGNEASLHIKLAHGHVLAGQLDAAHAALVQVFALPLNRRLAWLESDMKRLGRALTSLPDQRSPEFQTLQSGAEEFLSTLLSQNTHGIALT